MIEPNGRKHSVREDMGAEGVMSQSRGVQAGRGQWKPEERSPRAHSLNGGPGQSQLSSGQKGGGARAELGGCPRPAS